MTAKRIRIEVTEEQAHIITAALDFYMRVAGLHQYEEIFYAHRVGPHADKVEAMRAALLSAKGAVGLGWNASFSILDAQRVPIRYRVAHDLWRDLRGCPDDGVGALARGLGGEPAAVVGPVPEDDWR